MAFRWFAKGGYSENGLQVTDSRSKRIRPSVDKQKVRNFSESRDYKAKDLVLADKLERLLCKSAFDRAFSSHLNSSTYLVSSLFPFVSKAFRYAPANIFNGKHFKVLFRSSFLGMSVRSALAPTNIVFILAGIYFLVIAATNEGSPYSAIATVLCFISAGLDIRKEWFFSSPFRIASSVFVLILLASQLISIAYAPASTPEAIVSAVVNGVLFVMFLGVALSCLSDAVKKESEEEKEEEAREAESERKREAKKLTYEV
ncbi:MAG TPA: hypothetical protein VFF30_17820 [Nitrososphaerales archaeon]|nr:hypothetical protein [Nitrososphaerales archaeon]